MPALKKTALSQKSAKENTHSPEKKKEKKSLFGFLSRRKKSQSHSDSVHTTQFPKKTVLGEEFHAQKEDKKEKLPASEPITHDIPSPEENVPIQASLNDIENHDDKVHELSFAREVPEDEKHPENTDTPEAKEKKKSTNILVEGVLQKLQEEEKNYDEKETLTLGEKLKKGISFTENPQEKRETRLLAAARFLFLFSFVIPFSAWMVFQTILVENSQISRALSAKNYGTELSLLREDKKQKEQELKKLTTKIAQIQQDIEGIRNEKVLAQITDNRVDFLEIMLRINSITLKSLNLTAEVNRAINMLVFNSYSASTEKDGTTNITISGTVRDPKRMSFTKMTQLMETINKDPYFSGAEIRSFTKSEDAEGGARSSFTFHFVYNHTPDNTMRITSAE